MYLSVVPRFVEHQQMLVLPLLISYGKALCTSEIPLQQGGAAWLLQGCCSWKLLACGRQSAWVKGDLIINKLCKDESQGMIHP